ncbi:MAG: phosphatidylglycerophosphatase A [Gemmatimonadota bacterium]|nr:phosphatidylglycerophosphatase A [Gemmatimonadota bacterium]
MNPWTRLLATGFFSGNVPVAPGTAGTAAAAVPYLAVSYLTPGFGTLPWVLFLVLVSGVAVYTASAGEDAWGPDPGPVVIDEFVGFYVTVAFLPLSPAVGVAGFFIFRALDILKPPPVRASEKLPRGWGVVMDDVIAGIYGNLLIRAGLSLWSG